MKNFKKGLTIFGIIWLAVAFYFVGYLVGHKNLTFEQNYRPRLINLDLKKPETVDFSLFVKAFQLVSEKYVGTITPQKLVYGAIKGMVDSLGDPYSTLLESSDRSELQEDLSGKFEGIGAELSQKDNKIVVVAPLEGSPAEEAGLKPKDQILAIDNVETANMSLDEAIAKIRGKTGTEVTLLINREGFTAPREFKVKRAVITVKSVSWKMLDPSGQESSQGKIGYLKLTQFGDDTSALSKEAAEEIAKRNPEMVILDLRNNPGGYLDSAVDVASLFVAKNSVVVKEQYKDGHTDETKTTFEPVLEKYKVVVLVNEGSASAAEIVAGALKDLRGATLVGQKTFGKGSVQEIENLDPSAALKITIAKWLTPNGQTIDKVGLNPDIEIKLTDEDEAQNHDTQLLRALEEAK